MSSFYVHVSSEDSKLFYDNKPYDFTVYLPETIKFRSRHWGVALAEIHYALSTTSGVNSIDIYSDICIGSIIHEKKSPILRSVTVQDLPPDRHVILHKNFNPLFYMSISKNDIRQIRVYIQAPDGSPATFLKKVTRCTLHFKPLPK